jgi:hypothetical protein
LQGGEHNLKRTRITDWPVVQVNVNPQTLEVMERQAEQRALSVSAVIREALDAAYRQEAR